MPRLLTLLAVIWSASAAAGAELRTLTGNHSGELVLIDDKEVVVKTAAGLVRTPLKEVLQLDLQPQAPAAGGGYTLVELTDGTLLRVKSSDGFAVDGKLVSLTALPDLKVQVPIAALSYILKDGHDAKVRDHADWKAILKSRKSQDLLVKWYEGRLNGIGGTFGEGKGTVVDFTTESGLKVPADLNHKAIQGWAFVNRPDANAVALCKVHDMHHNLIIASKLEAKEGGDLVLTTPAGAKITYQPALVAKLDYSKGKLSFLSDLDAKVIREPDDERFGGKYRRDRNLEDGKLQMGGQKFDKGLALLAPTVLAYPLGGEFKEFSAWVGVDDGVAGNSHVRLIIEGDGKELYSAEVKRKDPRREVKLNIKDVHELRIRVESVPVIFFGHHLNIADAKISK